MKNVLLIGLGRFGRHMAQKLHDLNNQVLVIDRNERRVQDAMGYVTNAEIADATDPAVIGALGVHMTREMAECLFVAISTDCGQFNYSNTRARTFRAAARCSEAGIDIAAITEGLYRTRSVSRTKLLGLALAELELSPDGQLAWTRLTKDMLRRADAIREDKEGIVNYLQEMSGVRIAVLAEEQDGQTKFSLRTHAPLNVARDVAVPLGGGGHDCAAGVTVALPLEEALGKVLSLAREAIERAES